MEQDCGQWVSVQTRTGEEFEAEADLRKRGFEVFLPWWMVDRKQTRRGIVHVRSERAARFTGYIFAFVDKEHSVWRLRRAEGVVDVATYRQRVLPVAPKVMEKMRGQCTWDGYWPPEPKTAEELKGPRIGEVVMIEEGPFSGFPGTVESVDISARMMVLSVSIFGRATPVAFPLSSASARQPEVA
ncbi:transcription termination/antitermination protein NusG [Xanthobacter flavus]|uniref:transcription termination/antitermination protein NusG n=1 Tax=Xanthobacter flavus TaxID=281 RepID=UPI0037263FF8